MKYPVIASAAKQSILPATMWIASSHQRKIALAILSLAPRNDGKTVMVAR
jgi:hypothetical protein